MKNSDGFTIIECIIYLCLSSFFTVLVLQAYLLLQQRVTERLTAAHEHVALAISIDTIVQDIATAPINKSRWSSKGPRLIRWSDDYGNTMGFALSNNNLLKITRARGNTGTLRGPAYNVLARNIDGNFQVAEQDNIIKSVTIQATALVGQKRENVNLIMRPKAGIING